MSGSESAAAATVDLGTEARAALKEAEGDGRFGSLERLRAVHSWLLDLYSDLETDQVVQDVGFLDDQERFLKFGVATGAILDDKQDRRETQSLLDYWYTVLYRSDRRPQKPRLSQLVESLLPNLDDAECPYLGLDAFREENTRVFFGRRTLLESLLEKLKATPLLAVVGTSGSGKSSVVRAGLLPALRAGGLPESETWRILQPIVPGSDPLDSLARLVLAPGAGLPATLEPGPPADEPVRGLAQELRDDVGRLSALLDRSGGPPVVVVVDQFEEVFTLCNNPEASKAFLDNLVNLVRTNDGAPPRNRVILTMRSDFEIHVLKYKDLRALFDGGRVTVTPMEREELREAIERPAQQVWLMIEKSVVDALLEETYGEPGALPLLQFALLKLWKNRWHSKVRMEEYRRLGGVRLALRKAADELYGKMIEQNRQVARRIFLRIVRPGEGLEVTNKRVPLKDLLPPGEDHTRTRLVLKELVDARLVRLTPGVREDDAQIEVAHEALVRNWPQLVEWLDDQRAAIVKRQRWELKVAEWIGRGRGLDAQLDAAQLRDAQEWLDGRDAVELGVIPDLRALFEASRKAIEDEKRLKEESARRELEQALALAEAERQAKHIWRWLLILLIPVTLLAVAAAFSAFKEFQRANKEFAKFVATSLLHAGNVNADDADRKMFLAHRALAALESRRVEITPYFRQTLEGFISSPKTRFATSSPIRTCVSYSPDGMRLAAGGFGEAPTLWDADSGKQLAVLLTPKDRTIDAKDEKTSVQGEWVSAVAFSPNGNHLATGDKEGFVTIWDRTGKFVRILPQQKGGIIAIAFSKAGPANRLATLVAGQKIVIWDYENAKQISTFSGPDPNRGDSAPSILDVAYAPDGLHVATANSNGTANLWDVAKGVPLEPMTHPQGTAVVGVAFDPKGERLATRCTDGRVHLWNVGTRQEILPSLDTGRVGLSWDGGLAFSPDGKRLATLRIDEAVVASVWSVPDGKKQFSVIIRRRAASAFAFRPDLERFAVALAEDTPPYQTGDAETHSVQEFELKRIEDVLPLIRRQRPHITLQQCLELLQKLSPDKHLLLQKAKEQAEGGDEKSALGNIRQALDLPGLDFHVEQESRRLVAEVFIGQGKILALEGKPDKAFDLFQRARALDKKGTPDPIAETRHWRAVGLIERGSLEAMNGEIVKAEDSFREAKKLGPELDVEPESRAKMLAVPFKLNQGMQLVRDGKVAEAIKALQDAERYASGVGEIDLGQITADSWNELCWWGSLYGKASDVIFAGERAVELATADTVDSYKDTRGLARALTGQYPRAVEDFESYLNSAKLHPELVDKEEIADRRKWIETLKLGRNPFDSTELKRLLENELKKIGRSVSP